MTIPQIADSNIPIPLCQSCATSRSYALGKQILRGTVMDETFKTLDDNFSSQPNNPSKDTSFNLFNSIYAIDYNCKNPMNSSFNPNDDTADIDISDAMEPFDDNSISRKEAPRTLSPQATGEIKDLLESAAAPFLEAACPTFFHKLSYEETVRSAGFAMENLKDAQNARRVVEQSDKQLQKVLEKAASQGKPLTIVFSSEKIKAGTTALLQGPLKEKMKSGESVFLFIDTDSLDPASELGKVADRKISTAEFRKQFSTGVWTGLYPVEKRQDGTLGVGKMVANFSGTDFKDYDDQLEFAKNRTLKRLPAR